MSHSILPRGQRGLEADGASASTYLQIRVPWGTKAIGDRQALDMGRDDQGHSGTVKEEEEKMGGRAQLETFLLTLTS